MKNAIKTKKWNRPLSQKAYAKVIDRAKMMYRTMVNDYSEPEVIRSIDTYIDSGVAPVRGKCDYYVYIAFMSVKWVIDEAIERSAKARRNAAMRREKKEAEKAEKERTASPQDSDSPEKAPATDGSNAITECAEAKTSCTDAKTDGDTDLINFHSRMDLKSAPYY